MSSAKNISAGMPSADRLKRLGVNENDLARGFSRAGLPSDVPPKGSMERLGPAYSEDGRGLEFKDRYGSGFLPDPAGVPEDRNYPIKGKR
jgi:hypothetical protein